MTESKERKVGSVTSDMRNTYAQTKFRNNSKSTKKDSKQVAHILDLELATHILTFTKGKKPCAKLKVILNDQSNFRLVKRDTNLIDHRKTVKSLIVKSQDSKAILTKKEETRVRQQVEFLYSKKDALPKGFKKACIYFYKQLTTQNGETLLDLRKFK